MSMKDVYNGVEKLLNGRQCPFCRRDDRIDNRQCNGCNSRFNNVDSIQAAVKQVANSLVMCVMRIDDRNNALDAKVSKTEARIKTLENKPINIRDVMLEAGRTTAEKTDRPVNAMPTGTEWTVSVRSSLCPMLANDKETCRIFRKNSKYVKCEKNDCPLKDRE